MRCLPQEPLGQQVSQVENEPGGIARTGLSPHQPVAKVCDPKI